MKGWLTPYKGERGKGGKGEKMANACQWERGKEKGEKTEKVKE